MNNYEQLKQKVRKAIKPPCKDCEGKGFNYSEPVQIGESSSNCKTCNGKGYIEELEFGCELKSKKSNDVRFLLSNSEYKGEHLRKING